ncbi:basic helix-loop-helix transcription factor [Lithospermum erythrorhizon]|uniref:Basic helix-loop-helix transcription factor n=1 Tax=Lithospermum erythrorhizon TaxID=34254 RepID=A0AAV3P9G7_LITER
MDSIFFIGEEDRSNILQHIMQVFCCTYICIWQYLPHPSNCLLFLDGLHHELANDKPSSSSASDGSRSRRLFDQYRQAVFNINDNNGVPGLAFWNQNPFMELKLAELQRVASIEIQLQFYMVSVFMGCNNGEIEIGFPNDKPVDLEMRMKLVVGGLPREIVTSTDDQTFPSSSIPIQTTSFPSAQTIQALSSIRNVHLPNIESEDDVLTKALLAVITSPSSLRSQQNMPPNYQVQVQLNEATAFRRYNATGSTLMKTNARTQMPNMFKRAIIFYRGLDFIRRQEQLQRGGPRSQLHMLKERRRRERINENFRVLCSLLPPGTKNIRASVLASATEYLSSLKVQVAEFAQRNQILEAQLLLPQEKPREQEGGSSSIIASSSISERVVVRIVPIDQSTSEGRTMDLQVTVLMGQSFSMMDLAICVLEYLKEVNNVSVMSIEANTSILVEPTSLNSISVRLGIEGDEWDESGFQEAIRKHVADLAL